MPDYIRKSIPSCVLILVALIVVLLIPNEVVVLHETGVNARTFPYIAAGVIMVAGAVQALMTIITGWRKSRITRVEQAPVTREVQAWPSTRERRQGYVRVALLFLMVVLWIVLLKAVGYVIMTMAVCAVVMLVLGNRKPLQIVLLSVVLTGLTYFVFKFVLYVGLPRGYFFI